MYHTEEGWKKKRRGNVITWLSRNIVYIKLPFIFIKQVDNSCSNVFNRLLETEGHSTIKNREFSARLIKGSQNWVPPFKQKVNSSPERFRQVPRLHLWKRLNFYLEYTYAMAW